MDTFGARLKRTREALGYNVQADFARALDLKQSTYSNFETGLSRPKLATAVLMCQRFGLTLDWIYRGNPDGLSDRLRALLKITDT